MNLTKRILIAENGVSREHSRIITDLSRELKPQITSNAERARALLREEDLTKRFDLLVLDQDLPESQLVAITADSEEVPIILTYQLVPEMTRFNNYLVLEKIKQSDKEELERAIASFYNLNY